MSASVTTTVTYTEPGQANPTTSPEVTETVVDPGTGSVSGSADSSGADAESEKPNQDGGTDKTASSWKIPEGGTFKSAKATVKLDCGKSGTVTVECEGNVSAVAHE